MAISVNSVVKRIIEFGLKASTFINNNLFLFGTLLTGSILNFFLILFTAIAVFGLHPENPETINNFNHKLASNYLAASCIAGLIITALLGHLADRQDIQKNRLFLNIFKNSFLIGLFGLFIDSILIFLSLYMSISGKLNSLFEIIFMMFFVIVPFSIIGLLSTLLISLFLSFFFKTILLSFVLIDRHSTNFLRFYS